MTSESIFTDCAMIYYLSLDYFQHRADPLAHRLWSDRVKEFVEGAQQCRVSFKVIEMVIHPMAQHIQDSELHWLSELLQEPNLRFNPRIQRANNQLPFCIFSSLPSASSWEIFLRLRSTGFLQRLVKAQEC